VKNEPDWPTLPLDLARRDMRKGTGGNLSGTEGLRVAIIFRGTRAANLLAVPSLGSLRECSFRTLRCHTRRKQRLTAARHYELWPAITFERVVAAVISPNKVALHRE